jgi:RNA polymerase sigma factor (sigma-70 family)
MVQEIFTRALELLADYRDDDRPGSFGRWLFGVPARLAVGGYYRDRWEHTRGVREATRAAEMDAPTGPAPGPPLSADLADRVAALTPRCRQVVELRYIEGLPLERVAAIMGITPHNASGHAQRALRILGRPAGLLMLTPRKATGTPGIYRTADGWHLAGWLTGPDGTQHRKNVYGKTREIVLSRWAEMTSGDLASAA